MDFNKVSVSALNASDFCLERVDVFLGERQIGSTNDISHFKFPCRKDVYDF